MEFMSLVDSIQTYTYREYLIRYKIGEFYKGSFEEDFIQLVKVIKKTNQSYPEIQFHFNNGQWYALWYFLCMEIKSLGVQAWDLVEIQKPKQLTLF